MKLHILSDLHIEFAHFELPETDADVIVLAGDVGVGTTGVEWITKQASNKPIIYVPGNHEFYGHGISLIEELKNAAPCNVHVLDNEQVVIDGVRSWVPSCGQTFFSLVRWTSGFQRSAHDRT
jgi:predicted phosphodiesterase